MPLSTDPGPSSSSFHASSPAVFSPAEYIEARHEIVGACEVHRTGDDASGCTFVEQDPHKHLANGAPPEAMIINSSKLRGVFGVDKFKQRMPPAFGWPAQRARRAGVTQLHGIGEIRFVLDSERRIAPCEMNASVAGLCCNR